MEQKVLIVLDKISELTFKISDLYDKIVDLETNKPYLNDYDEKINKLCNKLLKYKNEEKDLYDYFRGDLVNCSLALICTQNPNPNPTEKEALCAARIIKNINRIYAEALINNPEVIPNRMIKSNIEEYLVKKDYSEEDSKRIALKGALLIEKSVAVVLNNLHYVCLKDIKDKNIREIYNKRNLKQALAIGSTYELELLKSKFTMLPNELSNELGKIVDGDAQMAQELTNMFIEINMERILAGFISETDPIDLDELFYQFKACILHVDINELEQYKVLISIASLAYKFNSKLLLEEIDHTIELRKKAKEKNM